MNIIEKAEANKDSFRPIFLPWLRDNINLFIVFEQTSINIFLGGRRRYSARTIFEDIRHNTKFRENGSGQYKINGDYIPDAARLFMILHPECGEFFLLRGRK